LRAGSPSVLLIALTGMLGAVIGVVCLVGGLYLLVRSGKFPLGPLLASVHVVATNGASAGSGGGLGPIQTSLQTVALEPMVVNLADSGGHGYLRLGLALSLETSAAASTGGGTGTGSGSGTGARTKGMASLPREQEIPIRDTMLMVLGEQTSRGLLVSGGRERLKQALLAALAAEHPELRVHGLYFSELLVQP
jgi:flagellar FliL protein